MEVSYTWCILYYKYCLRHFRTTHSFAEGASVKLSPLVTGPLVVSRKAEANNKQEYNVD
jgi:hypothetical protein